MRIRGAFVCVAVRAMRYGSRGRSPSKKSPVFRLEGETLSSRRWAALLLKML